MWRPSVTLLHITFIARQFIFLLHNCSLAVACFVKTARRTYEDGRPEAAEPVILPAPDDVENAADEHEQADDNEQPPGARFLVVDLHFLDDDDFRSHCGDRVGGLVVARCVKAASDERRRAQLVRRLRQDGA